MNLKASNPIEYLTILKRTEIFLHNQFLKLNNSNFDQDDDEWIDQAFKQLEERYVNLLKWGTSELRELSSPKRGFKEQELENAAQAFNEMENKLLDMFYSEDSSGLYTDEPLKIYSGQLIKDEVEGQNPKLSGFSRVDLQKFQMLSLMMGIPLPPDVKIEPSIPYDVKLKPSPASTPLARFRPKANYQFQQIPPQHVAIGQARAEIEFNSSSRILDVAVSNKLALGIGAAGWKERDPCLSYTLTETGKMAWTSLDLVHTPTNVAIDDTRDLFWISDGERIKSYKWRIEENKMKWRNHNTFSTKGDPHGMLPVANGSKLMVYTEQDGLCFWDVDNAPNHETTKIIGERLSTEALFANTFRDDDSGRTERSSGSKLDHTQKVEDKIMKEGLEEFYSHPNSQESVLCTSDKTYGVKMMDIERGVFTHTFVGHGSRVTSINTGLSNQLFLTGCYDGATRLYDVRNPSPVATTTFTKEGVFPSFAGSSLFVFSAGSRSQAVRCWDLRAGKCLYELSTGNTEASGIGFCNSNNTLYVGGNYELMDRLGYIHDDDFGMGGSDDEEEEDDELGEKWPKSVYHSKNYFGLNWDAKGHGIISYKFKEDADSYNKVPGGPFKPETVAKDKQESLAKQQKQEEEKPQKEAPRRTVKAKRNNK